MMDDTMERAGGAERPQESGGATPGRGGRMSRLRKTAAVLRLLRGEDLECKTACKSFQIPGVNSVQ